MYNTVVESRLEPDCHVTWDSYLFCLYIIFFIRKAGIIVTYFIEWFSSQMKMVYRART